MTKAEIETALSEVRTAISEILTLGQSSALPDREVTRADLRDLERREVALERRLDRVTRGGIRVRRVVPVD